MTSNPFSAKHLRPGGIPFVFAAGESLEAVLQRFDEQGRRGQIVGPHGTGKSTLLAELVAHLTARGDACHTITLGAGRAPARLPKPRDLPRGAILVIDGYEQLGWITKLGWHWLARRRGWGLLITAHGSQGLPTLYRTDMDADLARRVLETLVPGSPLVTNDAELRELLRRHRRNLREVCFELYDRWEVESPGEGR